MSKQKTATEIAVKETASIAVKEQASVESFIMAAIEKGLPVETMERLFALREKVKVEQAKEAFTSAMAKFQAECPVIEKTKKVYEKNSDKVRYSYAPLDSIVSQVKKPLGNNDLSYRFEEIKDETNITAVCTIIHKFGHSETSSFKVPIGKEDYMSDVQKYGSRMTFAKRYAFCNALGILTSDEDTDATEEKKKKAKPALNVKADIMNKLKILGVDITKKDEIRETILKLTGIEVGDEGEELIEIANRLDVLISEKNEGN